jgi:hypothetical protein
MVNSLNGRATYHLDGTGEAIAVLDDVKAALIDLDTLLGTPLQSSIVNILLTVNRNELIESVKGIVRVRSGIEVTL